MTARRPEPGSGSRGPGPGPTLWAPGRDLDRGGPPRSLRNSESSESPVRNRNRPARRRPRGSAAGPPPLPRGRGGGGWMVESKWSSGPSPGPAFAPRSGSGYVAGQGRPGRPGSVRGRDGGERGRRSRQGKGRKEPPGLHIHDSKAMVNDTVSAASRVPYLQHAKGRKEPPGLLALPTRSAAGARVRDGPATAAAAEGGRVGRRRRRRESGTGTPSPPTAGRAHPAGRAGPGHKEAEPPPGGTGGGGGRGASAGGQRPAGDPRALTRKRRPASDDRRPGRASLAGAG